MLAQIFEIKMPVRLIFLSSPHTALCYRQTYSNVTLLSILSCTVDNENVCGSKNPFTSQGARWTDHFPSNVENVVICDIAKSQKDQNQLLCCLQHVLYLVANKQFLMSHRQAQASGYLQAYLINYFMACILCFKKNKTFLSGVCKDQPHKVQ